MPLTDTVIQASQPKAKPYKLADGHGLYLLITHAGKYWRFKYRRGGKRKGFPLAFTPMCHRIKPVKNGIPTANS